ncbi:MAG: glycosyltransferase family 2 protein [Methylobacterium mesophilicum]|nr:glycosyltransferase family 2 protein [Methylobacterium mesophilicum]
MGAPAESATARSLVIPVYRNEENIPSLVAALHNLHAAVGGMEVIFVIDGSPDRSGELLLREQLGFTFPSKVVFHSRNFGSFTAIRTGLEHAAGEAIAVMAADLQEPPELIAQFFAILGANEADIVFGERSGRHDAVLRDALSNGFWWLYRKLVIPDVPKGGVDIFACNRMAASAVLEFSEPNSSLIAQLFWIGFRRRFVPYQRRQREHGKSAWNFTRRLRYMMDSIFSFSDLPILFVLWFGVAGCVLSLLLGSLVALLRLFGLISEPGYAAIVVLITFSASAILAVQGVIGSYLWRTFENTKRRPLRLVNGVMESRGLVR